MSNNNNDPVPSSHQDLIVNVKPEQKQDGPRTLMQMLFKKRTTKEYIIIGIVLLIGLGLLGGLGYFLYALFTGKLGGGGGGNNQNNKPPTSASLTFPAYAITSEVHQNICKNFRVSIQSATQISQISPIVNSTYVSSISLYKCSVSQDMTGWESTSFYSCSGVPSNCVHVYSWSVGDSKSGLAFPDNVGMFLGNTTDNTFVVQTRYFNVAPGGQGNAVDNSGFLFNFAASTRPFNAGILQVGANTGLIQIPEANSKYTIGGLCYSYKTFDLVNAGAVNGSIVILGYSLHAHNIGKKVWTEQYNSNGYRSGLYGSPNVVSNFLTPLYTPTLNARINPGDVLVTYCEYDSSSRSTITWGGSDAQNEMCVNYILYYSSVPNIDCMQDILTNPTPGTMPSQ